jgi:hypothetical protein
MGRQLSALSMAPGGGLRGKTIVFTGFRDSGLSERVEAAGGRVASTVSASTDILVVAGSKGVQSAKAGKARALGVKTMTRDEFEAEFFSAKKSFLSKLFGRRDEPGPELTAKREGESCWTTLDNDGRPFKVCVSASASAKSRRFWVLQRDDYDDSITTASYSKLVVRPTAYARVFVGKSPRNKMTEFSGGYGPKFDGNSMLFELSNANANKYMFVGESVRTFKTTHPIASFVSPVGNSGVPYPYATDRSGAVYLLTENVVLTSCDDDDPYDYYDRISLITPDIRWRPPRPPMDEFEGITAFYIGSKKYTLAYVPFVAMEFDRLSSSGGSGSPSKMYVVSHGRKVELTKASYVALMKRFGRKRGIRDLANAVLVPRLD